MTDLEKLNKIFCEVFSVEESALNHTIMPRLCWQNTK